MDKIDTIINQLNDRQREAVKQTQGPLLVVAGAGSGKTKMLTVRIAYLIERCGVDASEILAVTFTNKAAREMRERVRSMVSEGDKVSLTTFHSFCCGLLRRWQQYAGFSTAFTIYDDSDSEKLMKNVLKELKINTKALTPKTVLECISSAKNELIEPYDYCASVGNSPASANIQKIYEAYQNALMANQAVDFDDLIFKTYLMLKNHPELLESLQRRYKYFLVDEYQDTNHAQYRLISMISSASGNLCVVGDEDQSIYSWRGATIRNIQDFASDFPGARVVKLEQNYRSTQIILDAAGAVIAKNASAHPKKLWTEKAGGDKLVFYRAADDREEASWIVRKIDSLRAEGYGYSDFAVLFRMNSLSRPIEQALQRSGVPYDITGGTKFFDRREVKDILAYLRFIDNQRDGISLERIINTPKRGIGAGAIEKLYAMGEESLWEAVCVEANKSQTSKVGKFFIQMISFMESAAELPVSVLCRKIIDEIEYMDYLKNDDPETAEDRKNNVEALVSDIRYQEEDNSDLKLHNYLENIALHAAADDIDESAEKVHLMTLHNAKGLEFPVVFMVAMEEGVFPHHSSKDSPDQLEEERRLAYVGMTRACKKLLMSASGRRMIFGGWNANLVSRFIAEVPVNLFEGRGVLTPASALASRYGSAAPSSATSQTSAIPGAVKSKVVGSPFAGMSGAKWSKEKNTDRQSNGESGNMLNLKPGVKVAHHVFGYGIIEEVNGTTLSDFRIKINFDDAGSKTLLLQYTSLRVINEQ